MGRIKQTYLTRVADKLLVEYPADFWQDFNKNKPKVQEHCTTMSKRIRNRIAGYITRVKKNAAKATV